MWLIRAVKRLCFWLIKFLKGVFDYGKQKFAKLFCVS